MSPKPTTLAEGLIERPSHILDQTASKRRDACRRGKRKKNQDNE